MKLIYIANARIPTEKAHGIQIMKMCEAFALNGAEVELAVPRRFNAMKQNPADYFGVKENFKITKLPNLDLIKFGKAGYWIQSISFAIAVAFYCFLNKVEIIYSRDEIPLWFLSFFKSHLLWEAHDGRFNFFVKNIIKRIRGIVTITQGLKDFYASRGVSLDKIFVAHDGVDLKKFDLIIDQKKSREELGFPLDKKIVLYSGSFNLYDWKGVDVLLEASKSFLDDTIFTFVGVTKEEIKNIKNKYPNNNIYLIKRVPNKNIPKYLKSADILVLPNKKGNIISEKYTSPLKLFEYMASGVPIVASKLPSIVEVLNNNNAILVEPNNPNYLSGGIKQVLQNKDLADRISKQALDDVENYTWNKRAVNILSLIK